MTARAPDSPPDRFGPLHLGQLLVLIGGVLLLAAALVVAPPQPSLPDFDLEGPVELRKQAFFAYLAPRIVEANAEIRAQRQRLLELEEELADGAAPGWWDRRWLLRMAREYELDPAENPPVDVLVDDLKLRIDTVPPQLALVQAAIESGWGRSRFARQANNLFGHWCYEEGCGLIPRARPEGARHEVAAFASTRQAVTRYLHNLNTHPPYRPFRELRADARATGRTLDAHRLVGGLLQYSERREAYVEEVREALRTNETLIDEALDRVPRDWLGA